MKSTGRGKRQYDQCNCLDGVVLASLLGMVGCIGFALWQRYMINQTLQAMTMKLDKMKNFVSKTGETYDELHDELDILTGKTIRFTDDETYNDGFMGEFEVNSKEYQQRMDDKFVQSEAKELLNNAAQTRGNNKLENDFTGKFKERRSKEIASQSKGGQKERDNYINSKTQLSDSLDCTKNCKSLPVGEQCGSKYCKNKNVCLDKLMLKKMCKCYGKCKPQC